jgi:DNA polymerase-3 subunit epsilon
MDPSAPFVAIDFETADYPADSACSVGLVRVEGGRVVAREHRLIRPPRPGFSFTEIHGLRWEDVREAPRFRDVWKEMRPLLDGAGFLAAHNASFDSRVLRSCCETARLSPPGIDFVCTVALARRAWGIRPTKLPDVCRRLAIPLRHHDALSDAEACARIVMAYRESPGTGADRGAAWR